MMYVDITTNPEPEFYNDEGGKNARLLMGFVVRNVPTGMTVEAVKKLLSFGLYFESGQEVIFSSIHLRRKRKQDPSLTVSFEVYPNFGGYVSFRVEELISKDVQAQRFCFGIKLDGKRSCLTTCFDIRTKRKYVPFQNRQPEIEQRHIVNDMIKRNAKLIGNKLNKETFPDTPVRDLFPELTRLENQYPHMPIRYPADPQTPTTSRTTRRQTRTPSSGSSSSSSSSNINNNRAARTSRRVVVVSRQNEGPEKDEEMDLEGWDSEEEVDSHSPPTKKRRMNNYTSENNNDGEDEPRFPDPTTRHAEFVAPQTPTPQPQHQDWQFGGSILENIPEENLMILPLALRSQEAGNSLPLLSNGDELARSQSLVSNGEDRSQLMFSEHTMFSNGEEAAGPMSYPIVSNGEEARTSAPAFDIGEFAMATPNREFYQFLGVEASMIDPLQDIDINRIFDDDENDWFLPLVN